MNIRVTREGDAHRIVIEDNGVGFDVKKTGAAEGTHIGIANVKDRIERMCGGTLTIDSRIGEGTTVTLWIPASGK